MNARRVAVLAGVLTVAVGVVALVAPGAVPVRLDRAVVVFVGVVALVQAARVVQRRRNGRLDVATTPDPERAVSASQPGADLGSVLAPFLNRRRVAVYLNRLQEGLTAVAVAALVRYEGIAEAEARERVAAGTWTDDARAAAFLGDVDPPSRSLRTRLRNRLARESSHRRALRRTVDAIESVVERHSDGSRGTTGGTAPQSRDGDATAEPAAGPDSDRGVSTADPDAFGDGADGEVVTRQIHSTGHWRGVSAVALVGIGVGVIAEQPAVLLAGVVGIGYAAYARSPALPPGSVSVERTLGAESAAAGEPVTVTVTVTNASGRVLPDVRVVDGVPRALAVESGAPRCGTALLPGGSASFSYTVTARRGEHEFGPTRVVGRTVTGEREAERLHASATTLTCIPPLSAATEPVPLRRAATRFVGREPTDATGEGVEFAATREYRPGDPMRRIDWNRRARTRELTTVEFREERAATVVLLVDARPEAYLSPAGSDEHAVDRAVDAAGQLLAALAESGSRVGVAAAGAESCWLAPDAGVEHRAEARELLATAPALSPVPNEDRTGSRGWQTALRERLESGTQLVVLSPLYDDESAQFARQFDERGFPVSVVSPDPTTRQSPSHRLGRVARQLHVSELRGAGVPVVDWDRGEPLDAALARHAERGSE